MQVGATSVRASRRIVRLVLNSTPAGCQTTLGAAQNVRLPVGSRPDSQTRFLRSHTLWLANEFEEELSRSGQACSLALADGA